jgi:hypothetical protein
MLLLARAARGFNEKLRETTLLLLSRICDEEPYAFRQVIACSRGDHG